MMRFLRALGETTSISLCVLTGAAILYISAIVPPSAWGSNSFPGIAAVSACTTQVYGTFNVQCYGTLGNASTDDTAAIQAAETAAEALGFGRVIFPCGQYKIATGPVSILAASSKAIIWQGVCGQTTYSEGPPYVGATLINATAGDMVYANATGNFSQLGPRFYDIGFVGNARAQNCLHVSNFMNGVVWGDSFRECGAGILLDGVTDDSDWVVEISQFRNDVIGVDHAVSTTGGGNNRVVNNRFNLVSASDIAVRWQGGNAQAIFAENKCDGSGSTYQVCVSTQANVTNFENNTIENPVGVIIPWGTSGSNNGRGLKIVGNNFTGMGTFGTLSCTTGNSSTSVTSCSGGTLSTTSGIVAGMLVSGVNVNASSNGGYVYGTGGSGTSTNANTVTGINGVASVGSSTAVTLQQNTAASGAGTGTLTFCWPTYSWPLAWTYAVVLSNNTYQNYGGCPDNNHGNDGG